MSRGYYGPRYYGSYGGAYVYGYIGPFGRGYGQNYKSAGIKFNLDLVDERDRDLVKRGIVKVDGAEFGPVDRFDSWQNGSIPLGPGDHEVLIELEDGRIFRTKVSVDVGQVLHVYPRF